MASEDDRVGLRNIDWRRGVWIAAIASAVVVGASQLGVAESPAAARAALRAAMPEAPPRHWTAPRATIAPGSFVRGSDAAPEWIRGDGY